MAAFGLWLRSRRVELHLTQAALAERAGCARDVLRQFESEVKRPSRQLAERLADALEIPASERTAFIEAARASRAPRPSRPTVAPEPATPPERRALHPPGPQSELIGRAAERGMLMAQLGSGNQRLLTLVGPGGIGKTSLAIQVAADIAADPTLGYEAAVVLLAPVTVAGDVLLAIAEALGQPLQGARSAWDQVIAALRERAILLVLDNCEHLLGPGDGETVIALIRQLLDAAPSLRVLATSRERLRLRDERVIELGGLALPAADTGSRVDRSDAVRLFVERAQRVSPGFALSADNRMAVAQICRRLEGLPLAIELAAGWTRILPPHEIVIEIDRSLDFLSTGERDAPTRHRSLRAALEHSWQLLSDTERRALARLSVFRGGFERDAAWEVAEAGLPVLVALVDKSLIHRVNTRETARFMLHELVRQYAEERLLADPAEQRTTIARHAAHYTALLQRSIAAQTGAFTLEAWSGLIRNIDNVRAAWFRAAQAGDSATVLAMARGLMILYDTPGWVQEGEALFARAALALRAAGIHEGIALGMTLGFQGYFLQLRRPTAGAKILVEAVVLLEQAGEIHGRAQFLLHLGTIQLAAARFDAAESHHTEAGRLAEVSGDQLTRLWALFFKGSVALYRGDHAAAEQHLTACLTAWRAQDFRRGMASALTWLSEVARQEGRMGAAIAYAREGLQISSTAHDRPGIARALRELGAAALEQQDLAEADYLLTESCTTFRSLGSPWVYGRSRSLLIRLEIQLGRLASAQAGCVELLRLIHDDALLMVPELAYALALLRAAEGQEHEALGLLIALADTPGEAATLEQITQLRAALIRRLDPTQRAAAEELAHRQPLLRWLEELCIETAEPGMTNTAQRSPTDVPTSPPAIASMTGNHEALTPREIEVLRLIARGASNAAIAARLIISPHTAKHHVANICQKLGVTTRTEAAIRARELGIV